MGHGCGWVGLKGEESDVAESGSWKGRKEERRVMMPSMPAVSKLGAMDRNPQSCGTHKKWRRGENTNGSQSDMEKTLLLEDLSR